MASKKIKERWRQIPGYPDYDVSDLGRIRSWKGGIVSRMKVRVGADTYPRVTLQDASGEKKVERVHVLVARAFIGPANGLLVRHKSGKTNNPKLSNLEYGTYLDNKLDKHRHGTDQVGERNSQSELTASMAKRVYLLKEKKTQSDIASMFGISRQAVSDIHRGVTWSEVTGESKE